MAGKKAALVKMIQAAMFAALIAMLSQISIPMPTGVPLTLQTLAIALCGFVLGWKLGLASVGVWIAIGAVGLPVFSNFRGGVGMLLGVTGGFIFGFLPFAVLCGIGMRQKNKLIGILLGLCGMIVCHLIGIVQFSMVTGSAIVRSAAIVSIPYLPKDVLSVIAAYFLAMAVRKSLKAAKLM